MVFNIMKMLMEKPNEFDKILLVTGDGDFFELVNYLIAKKRFLKILPPAKKNSSSLYKKLGSEYRDFLNQEGVKKKIEYKKK